MRFSTSLFRDIASMGNCSMCMRSHSLNVAGCSVCSSRRQHTGASLAPALQAEACPLTGECYLLQAFEQVNKQLSEGTFRRVAGKKVVTELEEAGMYYTAEPYHQQYLARGGRFGFSQSAQKGATDKIRCYG